jgi:hypothetical protein
MGTPPSLPSQDPQLCQFHTRFRDQILCHLGADALLSVQLFGWSLARLNSFVCDASLFSPERFGICGLLIRDNFMLLILDAFSARTGPSTTSIRGHVLRLDWRLAVTSAEVMEIRTRPIDRLDRQESCADYPGRITGDDSDGKRPGENGVSISPMRNNGFLPCHV